MTLQEENEKLRGLLDRVVGEVGRTITSELRADIDAALSHQAEPVSRDWVEDFEHENGNYSCRCCQCGELFAGHKRRVVCKLCGSKSEPAPAQTVPVAQALRKMMTELEEIALIQPDCSKTELILKAVEALATRRAQSEQSGLVEPTLGMVQAACAAFRMDVSPMEAMTEALRAALSIQEK